MDERVRAFLWILGSGCGGGALGTAFGALAGAIYWRSGRSSGTRLALGFGSAFERFAGRALSRSAKGAVVGAVDGGVFLGLVGTCLGAVAVYRGGLPEEMLRPALSVALYLVGGAAFFGVLGYTLTRVGVGALWPVPLGGVLGAALGWKLAGVGGLLLAGVFGLVAGNVVALLWCRRYEPEFTPPTLEHTMPGPHRSGDDDIQGPPDFVQRSD
jgi:hypothetical protein